MTPVYSDAGVCADESGQVWSMPDVIVIFNQAYTEPGGRHRKEGEYAAVDAKLARELIADGIARLIRVAKEDEAEGPDGSEEETRG
jgi:hypothetical protein